MRLNRLTLENFRCFRQQEFDLSADVIAIYGRNGTGKTALFDALEFCLTGDIGRYTGDHPEPPSQYLVNAFAGTGTKVRLEIDSEERHWIEVKLNNSNTTEPWAVLCSDGSQSRKDFYFSTLIDKDYAPPRKEFEPLVELFRATMLLSQASLRHFIEAPAEKRSGLISNLVGAAYLQRCLEKARAVIAEGKRRSKKTTSEIEELSPRLLEFERQIQERESRLAAVDVSVHGESVTLEELFASFGKLSSSAAASTTLVRSDPDQMVSIWGAFCDEHLSQSRARLAAIAELNALIPQHRDRLVERDAATHRLQLLREESARVASGENALSERVTAAQTGAAKLRLEFDSLTTEYNRLTRLAQLFKSRAQIAAAERVILPKLTALEMERNSAAQKFSTLEVEANEAERKIAVKSAGIISASARLTALEQIQAALGEYANRQQIIAARRNEIRQSAERIEALATNRQRLQTEESSLSHRGEQLSRESVEVTSDNADLVQAILKLRTHSKDGVCPLCGHQHESEDDLQSEIDTKLAAISAVAARLQGEARNIEEQRNSLRRQFTAIDDEAVRLRHQRDEGDRQIESLLLANQATEEQALRIGTPLDRDALERALSRDRSVASAAQTDLKRAQEEAKIAEQGLTESRVNLTALNERFSAERSQLDQLHLQKAEIDQQIAVIEPPTSDLDVIIEAARVRLVAKRVEHEREVASVAALQRDLSAERERGIEVGRSIGAAERTLLGLTQAISDVTARLRSIKLPEESTVEQLRELHETALTNERDILGFRELIGRFKTQRNRVILESERDDLRRQHGELFASQQRLQNSRSEIETASTEAETWEGKLAVLVKDSVSQRLNQHRIESFRLFQSMIPTPFLFDDITVTQAEDGVRLGLRYRGVVGVVGEPCYFLSSAQANVLALSYFLSFSRRQRWCKLRTILMDDPVQHLDDLDAVALLDVVRALVVSDTKPRQQMIISTCDYNLYALMIRKFSCFPSEQLRFTALSFHDIGANGPDVRYDYGGSVRSQAA